MSVFLTDNDYLIVSRLLKFFSSSYGSNSCLKLFQTLDNSMNICTSMSSRIQHQLKCRYTISRLLSSAIKSQISNYHDGGIYFSIIFCSFILQFRDLSIDNNKKLNLFKNCLDLIDNLNIPKETITFNSVKQLIAIVRSVICKSLAYNHSDLTREHLCILSVKSFLENTTLINSSEKQLILTIEGLSVEQSTLFNGLLYQISTNNYSLSSKKQTRTCLYFSTSLAGDYTIDELDQIETDREMFEWIENTAERITKQILEYTCLHDGGLILCQKVIHPSIKIKLKKYGIETVDRLSRQYTPYFCYLTGCQPIETLIIDKLDQRYFGQITEIKQVLFDQKQFLQFFNDSRPFHTLLLCSNTEQALIELKECFLSSHHVLTNILLTKQALYGAGCSESIAIHHLKNQNEHIAKGYMRKIFQNIIRAQSTSECVIDKIHGHLWYLNTNNNDDDSPQINESCSCQLYSATSYFKNEWKTHTFYFDNHNDMDGDKNMNESDLFVRNDCPKYLDNFQMRISALKTAIETAINLLLISVRL